MEERNSQAITLLQTVWDSVNSQKRFSWRKLNRSMNSALTLAVIAGLKFEPSDFEIINKGYRWRYWADYETFYTLAAVYNISAARALERHAHRKPFFYHGKRLVVGSRLKWLNPATVTSVNDEKGTIIACTYKKPATREILSRMNGHNVSPIEHIYRISHKNLRKEVK